MAARRFVYSLSRFWRIYSLLIFACVLSFILFSLSQKDASLTNALPFLRIGSKLYSLYVKGGADEIKKLMDVNKLDYEFMNANSRLCFNYESVKTQLEVDEDYLLLNEDKARLNADTSSNSKSNTVQLAFLIVVTSRAVNFKHRSAIRQTWGKRLNKLNSKLIFFVGNPLYTSTDSFQQQKQQQQQKERDNSSNAATEKFVDFKDEENADPKFKAERFKQEMSAYDDIIQINMPDNDNFTSTKTLISIRWALTYCSTTKNLLVITDSTVLNYNLFEEITKKQTFEDAAIHGMCNMVDTNFVAALKLFYNDLYKRKKSSIAATSLKTVTSANKSVNIVAERILSGTRASNESSALSYTGQYCSNLGWIISMNSARTLWLSALRTHYMMRISPIYLNGYLAFKAKLKLVDAFSFHESIPASTNCLKVFETNPKYLMCTEDFDKNSRYASYIATWNSPAQSQLGLNKI